MSVKVNQLRKTYGLQNAVDGISFEAKKGEILGFLGPNGAGKSTTFKMITGFIPPTEGAISVCGTDISLDPIGVRKKIGYLPEHNPLYKDMYVKEYLAFVAGIHHIKNSKNKINEVIEKTGLEWEQHKQIGQLSKGFRQRVGLAQAIIHDPEVLILDEPTSGLDPNQLVEYRKVLKRIGEEKTLIFSCHIMQEVECLCDRVIIINNGKIVANDLIHNLKKSIMKQQRLLIAFNKKIDRANIEKLSDCKNWIPAGENRYELWLSKTDRISSEIQKLCQTNQCCITEYQLLSPSMEDVFQNVTAHS